MRLELLEGDLVHKLSQRECEVAEWRSKAKAMEAETQVRGEAIEKAQRVIQKMQEEMNKGAKMVEGMERECRKVKEGQREHHKFREEQ